MTPWPVTVKKAEAKNQATSGWRSRGSTGGAGSPCTTGTRSRGRRITAASMATFISTTSQGKSPTPAASSSTPQAMTVTMKPIEPHMRTRP